MQSMEPESIEAPSVSAHAGEALALPREPAPSLSEDLTPPRGVLPVADALLKSPATVLRGIREQPGTLRTLVVTVSAAMAALGLLIASSAGGLQFVLVPLKLSLGILFCAAICFPSLHIFASLSGSRQTAKETWGVLLMGITLIAVLLVGFAPIAWVFSQATESTSFLGGLHVTFFLISVTFGIGLTRRMLQALNAGPIRGIATWGVLFTLVALQLTTTLRPIVGEYDGELFHSREFFLVHWIGID